VNSDFAIHLGTTQLIFLLLVTLIPPRRIPTMPVIMDDGLNELLVSVAGHNRRKLVRTKLPLR